jgi:hypothetical protein
MRLRGKGELRRRRGRRWVTGLCRSEVKELTVIFTSKHQTAAKKQWKWKLTNNAMCISIRENASAQWLQHLQFGRKNCRFFVRIFGLADTDSTDEFARRSDISTCLTSWLHKSTLLREFSSATPSRCPAILEIGPRAVFVPYIAWIRHRLFHRLYAFA